MVTPRGTTAAAELGWQAEAALDVDMRVDQAGRNEGALKVYLFFGCVARAHTGDAPTIEGYVGVFDIPGQNVH